MIFLVSESNMRKVFTVSSRNLMDKDISVDEEILDPPLEPVKYVNVVQEFNSNLSVNKKEADSTILIAHSNENELEFLINSTERTNLLLDNSECHSNMDEPVNAETEKNIISILRRQSCVGQEEMDSCNFIDQPSVVRKVSFPSDEQLVTYREPEFIKCWNISKRFQLFLSTF